MKRAEVEKKYKWRLEDIFATDADWNAEFEHVKSTYKQMEQFKGKLSDKKTLLECLKLSDKLNESLQRLYVYSHMRRDEDGRNDLYSGMSSKMDAFVAEYGATVSFLGSEVSKLDEDFLASVVADPEFKDFDFMLKEIIRSKKFILSEKEEKLLNMAQKPISGLRSAFTAMNSMDLPLPYIKVDGKRVKLTHGTYHFYMFSPSQRTRRASFNGMYKALKSVINTVTSIYAASVAADNFGSEARGHKSALAGALHDEGIPTEVYENLINSVRANRKYLHEYVAIRKKALGNSKFHVYDMNVPIVDEIDMSLDYEEAYKTVLEGLKPMGSAYIDLLKEARDKGWIDVMENEGKRSGAYSWGCYGTHPYVLLNYSRTANDMFTIAHEMGHALHTYYSNQSQPYSKHGYRIFVAEVASTVNEVLLIKHLLKHTTDKKTRTYLLAYYAGMFRSTIFRQTQLAEFELIAHQMDAAGEPLTVAALSDKYYELNKTYYGDALTNDDDIRYEWARIPHFYSSFYVYQYATGLTSAVNLSKKILEDPSFAEVYRQKFLCAGGSDSPYEILKNAGVDLASPQPFEIAMQEFNDTLQELKKELETNN